MPRHRRPRVAAPALAALALAVTGCVGEPAAERRGPLATAQRMLAIDFGRERVQQHAEHRELLLHTLRHMADRQAHWASLPTAAAGEVLRTRRAAERVEAGAAAELMRRPVRLPPLLPSSREAAQHVADDGDVLWRFLWPESPLGEIDDRRHRTRYDDDRPEATVLQRILRRVRL